jgi:hypothetical protein
MPTFDWQTSTAEGNIDSWVLEPWQTLKERFDTASDAEGVDQWTVFVESVQELAGRPQTFEWQAEVHSRLAMLVQQLRSKPAPSHPTLFVSHQRRDAHWAEWVAWAATEAHFDHWLDIYDPTLTTVNALVLSPLLKSVLVASIIEMALLNSTHVVSMQTKNAQTSRWVP